jgi:hypothetical protein
MITVFQGQTDRFMFKPARKLPIIVGAIRMKEAFEVEIEGVKAKGKAGDYLLKGVKGDLYPCDAAIFEASYEFIKP